MTTVRLTMAQALVRHLAVQHMQTPNGVVPLFGGVFAIFGHGNVAGLGEALYAMRDVLPTWRAHNEQGMAHAAIAYAKALKRRRMIACTTSIGPGATNMVTAAAAAHVNRLPVLLLPGDVFVSQIPDPVLQQIEVPGEPATTVNDCFRPVSRFWQRIVRPEQLLAALPAAMQVLTDPVLCGPVTLALPQDVQAEAYDYPAAFFARTVWSVRRPPPDAVELARALERLRGAERPLIIAGGGVHYSDACAALAQWAAARGVPVAETQAGKGALPWDHPHNVGAIGVTGSGAANALARAADVVLAVGTRLTDFTTASRTLLARGAGDSPLHLVALNVAPLDARKQGATALVADAAVGLAALDAGLDGWRASHPWQRHVANARAAWLDAVDVAVDVATDLHAVNSSAGANATSSPQVPHAPSPHVAAGMDSMCPPPHTEVLPTDAQVLRALNPCITVDDVVVGAAGGLPGELHKFWRTPGPGGYHVEYGYSCMGYEIAGGLGVRMARPHGEVVVLVGDGSYLMMNSELATAVHMAQKLIVVLLDNSGYGCINRLQQACGGAPFNNVRNDAPSIDFVAHGASLGAHAERVASLADLPSAYNAAKARRTSSLLIIKTDASRTSTAGGAWWDVPVPAVSASESVCTARRFYEQQRLAGNTPATVALSAPSTGAGNMRVVANSSGEPLRTVYQDGHARRAGDAR